MKKMQAFLGMVNWCRLGIPNYGLLVKPLYGTLETAEKGTIMWTESIRAAFKKLKRSLMSAPDLGQLDLTKAFELFTYEQLNVALGVLAQHLGDQQKAVAYFSKQLDSVSLGCLKAVELYWNKKGGHCLSPSRMLKYHSVLLEQDDVTLKQQLL